MGRSLLILAVLVGLVILIRPFRGGERGGLRGWPWLIAGLAAQILWVRVFSEQAAPAPVLRWLPAVGLLLALRFVWLNRGYRGLHVLAIGAGLNLLVMAANGGLMPISPASIHAAGAVHHHVGTALALTKNQLLAEGTVRLPLLDDRVVTSLGGLHIAFSLGDLLVVLGCLIALGEELRRGAAITRPARAAVAH